MREEVYAQTPWGQHASGAGLESTGGPGAAPCRRRPDKKQVLDYAATGVIWTANPRFRRRLSSCRTCLPFARLSKWFAPRS